MTKKLSDTNYLISTPDCRRKSGMVHVNMLKSYVRGESVLDNAKPSAVVASSVADDVVDQDFSVPCGRLNSFI